MTTPVPTVAGALTVAADLIEEHGHARGVFQNADGCLCAIGALRLAVFGKVTSDVPEDERTGLYYRARTALAAQVEPLSPQHLIGGKVCVVSWSDFSTQAEVVAALRAAAELAGTGVAS
jgi:hypothetical protein